MKMKKYILSGLVLVAFTAAGFAQDASEESQIALPDLTTVVSGSNEQEDIAPAPDFDDVLELPYNSGDLVPVLPAASAGGETDVVNATNDAMQKDIYAEGAIGGGYPASFTGTFEVSRLYGAFIRYALHCCLCASDLFPACVTEATIHRFVPEAANWKASEGSASR